MIHKAEENKAAIKSKMLLREPIRSKCNQKSSVERKSRESRLKPVFH